MRDLFRSSLRSRLSLVIALLVALTSTTIGFLAFDAAESALSDAASARMKAIAESREAHIVTVLRLRMWQAAQASASSQLVELLRSGNGASFEQGVNDELVAAVRQGHWYTLSAVAMSGIIVASSNLSLVGTDVGTQDYFEKSLSEPTIGSLRKTNDGETVYRITVPVRESRTNRVIGLILGDSPAEIIQALLLERSGLGTTGESYLVDDSGMILTASHFISDADSSLHVGSDLTDDVLQGRERVGRWLSYRNRHVVGCLASAEVRKTGVPWTIVMEMDAEEALDAAFALRNRLGLIALLSLAFAIITGIRLSTSLVRPVAELAAAAKRIGEGDLSIVLVDDGSQDEVGILRNAFRTMTQNLQKMLGNVQGGVKLLASSASEIAASAKEAAASASEQASIVSQVSSTADELRQTSLAATEQAQQVVGDAEGAMKTGKRGAQAVSGAVEAIGVINTRMQDVSQKNRRLSEQSGQLVEIIDAVQELAEQSNLLAVNASIEAAKAGDHGRGFSVVAAEVRSLAEQSKRATQQIRRTLLDIQRSAEDAVVTSADGAARVDDGTRAMQAVRGVFDEISGALEESADRSRQIAATTRQQAAGVEQIAQAMASLSQAGHDAAAMARQLEQAGNKLRGLGLDLKEMTGRYGVVDDVRAEG